MDWFTWVSIIIIFLVVFLTFAQYRAKKVSKKDDK